MGILLPLHDTPKAAPISRTDALGTRIRTGKKLFAKSESLGLDAVLVDGAMREYGTLIREWEYNHIGEVFQKEK